MNPYSEFAVDARGIARRFGSKWVLRGVTVTVAAGEVVGVLGANGSGKTTLLRILATLLKPTAGAASVFGSDVVTQSDSVRAHVNYLGHAPGLYEDLTAHENLVFAAKMGGFSSANVDEALVRVGLSAVTDDRVRGFSSGMQRRLALARLLLRPPRLLLLDEPYSNLDSEGIAVMNEVFHSAKADGGAALIVLHELAPAAGILDRTVEIIDGRTHESGELKRSTRPPVFASGAAP